MFVTFEGPEGAGKSTALADVAQRLRAAGRDVLTTREPGAGEFGAAIRTMLLHGGDMSPRAELFLFLADRSQHVATIVRPALDAGRIVLCDRYADSTFVYQAIARSLDQAFVKSANAFATEGLVPDITFLFDLDPVIGLARVGNKDRLDAMPLEFHQKVRAGFLKLAAEEPTRWVVLDAEQTANVLANQVWDALAKAGA